MYDAELGTECFARRIGSSTYCAGSVWDVPYGDTFADSQCKIPLYPTTPEAVQCGVPSAVMAESFVSHDRVCDVFPVRLLAGRHDGDTYFVSAGRCQLREPEPGIVFYDLEEAALETEVFVELADVEF